jgi:hypothetical protein
MSTTQLKLKKNHKKALEESLKEFNLTVDEALSWLSESQQALQPKKLCGSASCENPYRCNIEGCEFSEALNCVNPPSNVTFIPGDSINPASVFVGTTRMTGLVETNVTYVGADSPVLRLTIRGAKISN